nr:hypothetical protein [Tanacetum cinerariifolium]
MERAIISELAKLGGPLTCNIDKMIDDLSMSNVSDRFNASMARNHLCLSGQDVMVTNLKAESWSVRKQFPHFAPPIEMLGEAGGRV